MSERAGRYIIRIGDVIHGVFPKPAGHEMTLKPDPVPYEVSSPVGPTQLELNLNGGYSVQSPSRADVKQVRRPL
jgi:hypothetical protein